MRGLVTAAALVLVGGCLSETAWAQKLATPASPAPARPERFIGLEFFGGAAVFGGPDQTLDGDPSVDGADPKWGWEFGGTAKVGVRWLGITGAFGRVEIEKMPTDHWVVGPRVTTVSNDPPVRFFAHVLVGRARTSGDAPSQSSAEWVVGGGIDVLILRLQMDAAWLKLNGVRISNVRFFVGGVIPLCLRACDETDLIPLASRRNP